MVCSDDREGTVHLDLHASPSFIRAFTRRFICILFIISFYLSFFIIIVVFSFFRRKHALWENYQHRFSRVHRKCAIFWNGRIRRCPSFRFYIINEFVYNESVIMLDIGTHHRLCTNAMRRYTSSPVLTKVWDELFSLYYKSSPPSHPLPLHHYIHSRYA